MTGATLRLDKWLWFARLARTRSLATRLCQAGGVSIGGSVMMKPHHPVRVGDHVTVAQGRVRRRLVIAALGDRRGPAEVARLLYHETEPPLPLVAFEPGWTTLFDDAPGGETATGEER